MFGHCQAEVTHINKHINKLNIAAVFGYQSHVATLVGLVRVTLFKDRPLVLRANIKPSTSIKLLNAVHLLFLCGKLNGLFLFLKYLTRLEATNCDISPSVPRYRINCSRKL